MVPAGHVVVDGRWSRHVPSLAWAQGGDAAAVAALVVLALRAGAEGGAGSGSHLVHTAATVQALDGSAVVGVDGAVCTLVAGVALWSVVVVGGGGGARGR